MKRTAVFFLLATVSVIAFSTTIRGQQNLPPEVVNYADLIVTNGRIYSADESFSVYQAMAVRDGKVLAVGRSDVISRMAGPNTERVDLHGRSVVPGFFDTHRHGANIGNSFQRAFKHRGRTTFKTIEVGLQEVKELVDQAAPGEWVGFGGPRDNIPVQTVTRWQLDTVSPNNPVIIDYAGELSVVNSVALKMADIPLDTPGLLKNEQGEPTGQLRTWAHGIVTFETAPWPEITDELLEQQKQRLWAHNQQGLTTLAGRASGLSHTIYRELWERGELTARIRTSHEFLRSNPRAEIFLKRMGKLISFGLGEMVKIYAASTQHADGTSSSGGMLTWMRKLRRLDGDPYGEYGEDRWSLDPGRNDSANVALAVRYGWNVSGVHNDGDRATWLYLKAIEKGHQDVLVKTSKPFGADHQFLVTQDNIDLMKKYNVIPSMGIMSLFNHPSRGGPTSSDHLIYQYGPDAVQRMSPLKTMVSAGLRPASEEANPPLWAMQRLVTRTDDKGRVWGPDQRLTRQEALWSRTLWSAGYVGEEDLLGSLEPGKLADFVILGGDFMKVPEDQIADLPIDFTYLGGKIVYENKGEAQSGVASPQ